MTDPKKLAEELVDGINNRYTEDAEDDLTPEEFTETLIRQYGAERADRAFELSAKIVEYPTVSSGRTFPVLAKKAALIRAKAKEGKE